MSRANALVVIGVLTILVPFSGLPGALRTLLLIGFGAAVLGIGVAERSKEQRALLAAQGAGAAPAKTEPEPPSTPTMSAI